MPNSNLNMGTILFPNQPAPFIITDQQARSDIQSLKTQLDQKATAINNSTSGSLVSVNDAASMPAVQLITHIEPVQAGSGDPSPDNVRPISGWDKAIAQGAGKNLMPNGATTLTTNGITYTVNDDLSVTVNGTATRNAYLPFDETTYLSAGTVVVLDSGSSNTEVSLQLYIKRDDGTIRVTVTSSGSPVKFTVTESITYMGYLKVEAGVTVDNVTVYPSLRLWTETNEAYEPYNGQRLTADLPETVYGGLINWKEGKILSDWRFVDLGEYEWTARGNGIFWARITAANDYPGMNMVCTAYKTSTASNPEQMEDKSVWSKFFAFNNQNVIVKDTRFATGAELKSALSGVMLVFKTQTATEYQMTPQQLDMLKGTNNVWSDSGDTSVVYVADTKLYIDNKLAAISAAMLNL